MTSAHELGRDARTQTVGMPQLVATAYEGALGAEVRRQAVRLTTIFEGFGANSANKVESTLGQPLERRLYEARAVWKLLTAEYAMHMSADWRTKLFRQIDSLLDVDEWDPRDSPVARDSARTFLRMILLLRPKKMPGIGADAGGNIIAHWRVGGDFLNFSCRPNDELHWSVAAQNGDSREISTGSAKTTRVMDILKPFGLERFLFV